MTRSRTVSDLVSSLAGVWKGVGEGGYPTLEPFRYREALTITRRPDHPSVHYEQQTWRLTDDGEVPSHWETGLLRISSDGSVSLRNAQGGRVEAMEGAWERVGETWVIRLASVGFAGDPRMVSSARTIRLSAETLDYEMLMATDRVGDSTQHLIAGLTR